MSSTVKYSEIRPNFANSVQNLANSQIDIFWYFQCTVVFFLNGNYQDVHIVYKRKSEKTSSIFFCNNCSRILPHLDALHRWKSIVEYVFNFVEMSTTKQLLINADSAKSLKSQRQVIFWYFFIFFSFKEQRTFHENGESFSLIIIHLYTHTVIHIFVRTKLQDIQVFTWHELLSNICKHYDYIHGVKSWHRGVSP